MSRSSLQSILRSFRLPRSDVLSRIVRFEDAAEESENEVGDPSTKSALSYDYDSCISPSERVQLRKDQQISLPDGVDAEGYRAPPVAHTVSPTLNVYKDDYDSCLSPVSTPRWSVDDLQNFKRLYKDASFKELHKLVLEGRISHFSATPMEPQITADTLGKKRHGKTLTINPHVAPGTVIVPGSFDPLHEGHMELGKRAARSAQNANGEFYFEMSTVNVDKGAIPAEVMEKRVNYIIAKGYRCLVTGAILFDEKSELFPNCIFAIGYDTYVRVVNPKYYPKILGGIDATMARIEANGCEFFVGGRLTQDGVYTALTAQEEDVLEEFVESVEMIPPPADSYRGRVICTVKTDEGGAKEKVCKETPMSPIFSGLDKFRHDISSTEIRNNGFSFSEEEVSDIELDQKSGAS